MREEKIKNAIKAGIAITIIATIIIFVITIIMQYNEEGEKNMPFELSKITIVSTAEGIETSKNQEGENQEENNLTWKFNVLQNNDLYFTMPSFELKNGESKELNINWEYGYGKLR